MIRDLWYKSAVVYSLEVGSFQDSDGDGVGDFHGLAARLDYLVGLGVTCLWLLPFFPSPNRDNGYDVTDYYDVDPRHGTLGDFVEFMHEARERGLRVIVDLVVNHTSDRHPWFQAARRDPDSRFRDFYVWSDSKPEDPVEPIFPGEQESSWSWDEEAGAWYLHRFYHHQPDLNVANPEVREEICKIMGFWLELGVSGFRIDAAPYLIELRGTPAAGGDVDPFRFLTEFRRFLSWRRGDAILLAEANVGAEQVGAYFGDGDRLQMAFDFILNQHVFLALARERAEPIVEALSAPPSPPEEGQWATFLRNHDELTLDRLSLEERHEVFAAFAPEEGMRIYGRGIRRRVPPMLEGDPRRVRMAYSLLLTLPGTPVIRYGEEIGMGDDLSLEGRSSVRTVMQWSADRNGGFSVAAAEDLVRPAIREGPFGYERVSVEAERCDPDSLLQWMENALRTRRQCPEFGWGHAEALESGDPSVLAHRCAWKGGTVIAVHNLSGEPRTIELDLSAQETDRLTDLLSGHAKEPIERGRKRREREPYGFRWFRAGGENRVTMRHPGG